MSDEDYDFEYEDDDDEPNADAYIENKYYNAKEAVQELQDILEAETDMGFKALKQQTKINFHRGLHERALKTYRMLLKYTKSTVTRNYTEKTVNSILDYVSSSGAELSVVEEFYNATNEMLAATQSDRLNMKIKLKLAKLWLSRKEWSRLTHVLRELRSGKYLNENEDGQSKGTLMLELLALEVQMYQETNNLKMVKMTFQAAMGIRNAIPHPRTMGMIRESGGKMYMAEAQVEFFQAFRSYDEAGSELRIKVLKYLVLAHMLTGNDVNPFDSQETKPYREDPNIIAMTSLVNAYQQRDVLGAEQIVRENASTLTDDDYICKFITDVLNELRVQYLIDAVRPYKSVRIMTLANLLHVSYEQMQSLVLMLILDGRMQGRIDDVNQTLQLDSPHDSLSKRHARAMHEWSNQLSELALAIRSKQGVWR